MIKFLLLAAFTLNSYANVYKICSPLWVATLDPARAHDDLARMIIGATGTTLFSRDFSKGRLLKSFDLSSDGKILTVELADLFWETDKYLPTKNPITADDLIYSLTRNGPKAQKTMSDLYDFVPFETNVGQYIEKIEKITEKSAKIFLKSSAPSAQSVFSHPNSAILSYEHANQLYQKNKFDLVGEYRVLPAKSRLEQVSDSELRLIKGSTTFNFHLGLPLKDSSSCDAILQLSDVDAKNYARLFSMEQIKAQTNHIIGLVFNGQGVLQSQRNLREIVAQLVSTVDLTGEMRAMPVERVKDFEGVNLINIWDSAITAYQAKEKLKEFSRSSKYSLSFYIPEEDKTQFYGGLIFRDGLVQKFKSANLPVKMNFIQDKDKLFYLAQTDYDISILDVNDDFKSWIKCSRPKEYSFLHYCLNEKEAAAIKDLIFVPIYRFKYNHLMKTKNLHEVVF